MSLTAKPPAKKRSAATDIPEWQLRLLKKAKAINAAKGKTAPKEEVAEEEDEAVNDPPYEYDDEEVVEEANNDDDGVSSIVGLVFCITGALSRLRADVIEAIENAGGVYSKACTKKVQYLICNYPGSRSHLAAQKHGTKVVTEAWLDARLQSASSGKVQTAKPSTAAAAVVPKNTLLDGETAEVEGSRGTKYGLKRISEVYSCSCPAWRNQSLVLDARTCKHLRAYLGDAFEDDRVGGGPSSAGGKKVPIIAVASLGMVMW